jgi:hypothetical protein
MKIELEILLKVVFFLLEISISAEMIFLEVVEVVEVVLFLSEILISAETIFLEMVEVVFFFLEILISAEIVFLEVFLVSLQSAKILCLKWMVNVGAVWVHRVPLG